MKLALLLLAPIAAHCVLGQVRPAGQAVVREAASDPHRPGAGDAARRRSRRQLPLARGRQLEPRADGPGHARSRRVDRPAERPHPIGARQPAGKEGARREAPPADGGRRGLDAGGPRRPLLFSRREGTQNQPSYYWRKGYKGDSKLLLDPAQLDPSGLTTITWISPSHDGQLVAYGTYKAGDENTTLYLMEVETGKLLPLQIPNKTQAPDWMPDGSGFLYQNLKDPKNPYSGQVLFHRMGTEVAADPVLFRQFTKEENEKLATTWGPGGSLSRDGRWLTLVYWTGRARTTSGWPTSSISSPPASSRSARSRSARRPLRSAIVEGDTLFVQTNLGRAERPGRCLRSPVEGGRRLLEAAAPSSPNAPAWRSRASASRAACSPSTT
jgi:hypothetical protein